MCRSIKPLRKEAEWTDDVSAFLPPAWVDAAGVRGRYELPPRPGVVYGGTTDPTGGGPDAWPLCIWHVAGEGDRARLIIDVLRSHRRTGSRKRSAHPGAWCGKIPPTTSRSGSCTTRLPAIL